VKRAWLEVDVARTGRTDRYCLEGFDRVVVGRAPEATLRMSSPLLARQHFAFTRVGGRWQVADLGSPAGIFMNGQRVNTARWLDPGDKVTPGGGETFRFVEEPISPQWLAHAQRLAVSDDSDPAWLVFADALQDLGDDTGRRMVTAGDAPVLPLGFLDRMRTDGTVGFSCRYGFIRVLTVRNAGLARELGLKVFDAILLNPLARLLTVLELDVTSFADEPLEKLAAAVMNAAPPSLKTVRLLGVFGAPPRNLFPQPITVEWAPI